MKRKYLGVFSLGVPLLVGACDLGEDEAADAGEQESHNVDGAIEVPFRFTIGDEDVACGIQYTLGATAHPAMLRDMRMYVSNLRLINADGDEVPIELNQESGWQYENVVLLDFEDGTDICMVDNTTGVNNMAVGTLPAGNYRGLVFDLGVPFELNHLDVATAPPPLDNRALYRSVLNGYKFMKVDIATPDAPYDAWWNFHLGSQNCASMAPDQAPDICGRPLLASISLPEFDPTESTVVFDLAQLLADVDLTKDAEGSAPGCMSFAPDVNECIPPYARLGLDYESGECFADCTEQTAFRVQ